MGMRWARDEGHARRERRVHDGVSAPRTAAQAFLAFCGDACRGCAEAARAPLYTRLAEGSGATPEQSLPLCISSTRPRGGSRLPVPAQLDQLWDDIRDELRRETPDFKFHIWLEPLELAGVQRQTLYVRAPEHIRTSVAERYLPLLRRAAAPPLRPPGGGRGRRRRLVRARGRPTPGTPERRPARPRG